jgi:hypothetical protein
MTSFFGMQRCPVSRPVRVSQVYYNIKVSATNLY